MARKLLLLLIAILIPGGLFVVAAALGASVVGKRFPQISTRLRQMVKRDRRLPAEPAPPESPLQPA